MFNLKNFLATGAVVACGSLLYAGSASAALVDGDLISVDIARTGVAVPTGAAVVGSAGDVWNAVRASSGSNVAALGAIDLNLVDGVTDSGVDLSISTGTFNGTGYDSSNLDVYEGNIYLDGNGQFGPSGPSTVTLSGLGAGTQIDLYIYSGSGTSSVDPQGGSFESGGTTKVATDSSAIKTVFTEGDNYVVLSGLVADGSGEIDVIWNEVDRFGTIDAIQVLAVPEPGSLALLGLGGLCVLRRRRRG